MYIDLFSQRARRESKLGFALGVIFLGVCVFLFADLWVGKATIPGIFFLNQEIHAQEKKNAILKQENDARIEQVKSLKSGNEELELRARKEIGMLKPGEIFYEIPDSSEGEKHENPSHK